MPFLPGLLSQGHLGKVKPAIAQRFLGPGVLRLLVGTESLSGRVPRRRVCTLSLLVGLSRVVASLGRVQLRLNGKGGCGNRAQNQCRRDAADQESLHPIPLAPAYSALEPWDSPSQNRAAVDEPPQVLG